MNNNHTPRNGPINGLFITILVSTVILLISFTVALFFVMANESDSSPLSPTTPSGGKKPAVSAGVYTPKSENTTPLFPTKPSRSSYIIGTSSNVKTLTDDSEIKSNNTILVELGSYTSIVEKNADAKMYPASMTKVMTLIVACERVTNLDKILTVSQEKFDYAKESGGSGFGLKVGNTITVEDALYLIGYESDTIASLMIAEYIAGSEKAFAELMNNKASQLGLTQTHFANCTGLFNEDINADNNYTTCREMASIMAYAIDNEQVYKVLSVSNNDGDYFFMLDGDTKAYAYAEWYKASYRFNQSPVLKSVTVKAGKTGYIDQSGVSLVSYAVGKDGTKYINVIVGNPNKKEYTVSTNEVKYIYNTYAKKPE